MVGKGEQVAIKVICKHMKQIWRTHWSGFLTSQRPTPSLELAVVSILDSTGLNITA
jgi:hypothetical protein